MYIFAQLPSFRKPALFLLIALGLAACREDPDPALNRTKTFADFFVRYLVPEQQIKGQVSFWEGLSWETLKPVIPDGIISFENRKMTAKELPGGQIRFSKTYAMPYKESLAFRFRNKDGRYLQYELKMTPVRDFFVKGEISKSSGATFVINGGVMSKEESLVFLFTDSKNVARAITVEGPNPDVEITLTSDQLKGLSPGRGQLYLVKKQHKAESHPNLELKAAIEYYTDVREVVVGK